MSVSVVRPAHVWHSRFSRAARSLTIVGLLASAVSIFARSWWIADLIANLRIQLILGLLAALICSIVLRDRKLTGVSALLLLWQSSWLWGAVAPVDRSHQGPQLTVCTINVLTQNSQHSRIIECLKEANPDVIAVLELSSGLEEQLIRELGDSYPFRLTEPQDDGNFGIGLFSRFPFQESRVFHLTVPLVPSIQAVIKWNSRTVRLVATHPVPPVNARFFRSRTRHLQLLAERIQTFREGKADEPVIVVGDLNLTPWSPLFGDFLAESELRNGSQGRGLTPTWYRWPMFPFGLVLDHGFCSYDLVCTGRTVHGDVGSDHRPVTFRFAEQH
jgi:endonuclease/exonuclease/phosphatase (EEP) superfamily protein YafD